MNAAVEKHRDFFYDNCTHPILNSVYRGIEAVLNSNYAFLLKLQREGISGEVVSRPETVRGLNGTISLYKLLICINRN